MDPHLSQYQFWHSQPYSTPDFSVSNMLMILVPTLGSGHPNRVTLDLVVSQEWIHPVPTLSLGNPNLTTVDSN